MVFDYSLIQWLFFFYFYCFVGWCFESTYVSIKSRKLTNRGFLRGPFLPIYGSGAIMMLVVSMPFRDSLILTYIAGCIGATILEYVTGVWMESLFKVRYWDYSNNKFNFQGHICLGSSIAWGFFTILMTKVIHKPVESFVLSIPTDILTPITLVLTALIGADVALSFKAALDLRAVLVRMEKAKEDMARIQKRLDAMMEQASESLELHKEEWAESLAGYREGLSVRFDDLKGSVGNGLELLYNAASKTPSGYLESIKNEIAELRERYNTNVAERERSHRISDFFQRNMLRGNPTMSSVRFKEALEELKKHSEKKDVDKE